jgi:hypothetical protein
MSSSVSRIIQQPSNDLIELAVIGVVLAGVVIGIVLNPEVISKLPLLYVLALTPTLVLVTVGYVRKRWKHRAIESGLDRLLALRDAEGQAVAVEGGELYEKLRQSKGWRHLAASKDFSAGAVTSGSHQLWCLRLIVHYAQTWDEAWVDILRDHQQVLRAAPMPTEEKMRLDELLAPPSVGEEKSGL